MHYDCARFDGGEVCRSTWRSTSPMHVDEALVCAIGVAEGFAIFCSSVVPLTRWPFLVKLFGLADLDEPSG